MKELKENIKKNNMKKLVLSVTLGMFCYCANNAMKKKIEIDDVLMTMLEGQNNINEAKKAFKKQEPRIYSTIKDEEEKVKKGELLNFIKSQLAQKGDQLKKVMKIIEKYFHLEEQEEDYECTEDNLTEIFWVENEDENENEKINKVVKEINQYFVAIHNAESSIDGAFKEYYEEKKAGKGDVENVENVENVEDVVIKEIMNDCCGDEKEGDIVTKFIGNLKKMDFEGIAKEAKDPALAIIEKRITLSKEKETREKDFISFLKQKIGEEGKKEEKKEKQLGNIQPAEEGGPCCNC